MNTNYIQKICLFLFFLVVVVKSAGTVELTSINGGKNIEPGQNIEIKFKLTSEISDGSFDIVLRNEDKSYMEILYTVKNTDFDFKKVNVDNTVQAVPIPNDVKEGQYMFIAYANGSDEKISDRVNITIVPPTTPAPTATTTGPTGPSSTSTGATESSNSNSNNDEDKSSFIEWSTRNIIIISSLGVVIIVALILICYCCFKSDNPKNSSYTNEVWKLPPSVSSPQLISSSSPLPVNAIPINWNNNNPRNGSNSNHQIQNISSPMMNSNNRYQKQKKFSYQSQDYEQERISLTVKNLKQENMYATEQEIPPQRYRDTIYSSNSDYLSDEVNTTTQDEISSPTPSYYFQAFKPHQVYRVLYDFQPSLPDEMEIQTGDIIRTEETFEDGWAYGINMTTGKQGTFPLNCLEDDFATEADSRSYVSDRSQSQRGRRTSSLPNSQSVQKILNNVKSPQNTYYSSQVNKVRV